MLMSMYFGLSPFGGSNVHIGFLSRCFIHRVSRLGAENVYSGCVRNAILL